MTKPKVPIIQRSIPKEIQIPLRSYASAIGELVWSYNFAHSAFEILYCQVLGSIQLGRATWHTVTSDNGQIQLLKNAANASNNLADEIRKNILWAAGESDNLRTLRNDAVHSATVVINGKNSLEISPSEIGTSPKRFERIKKHPDLKKHLRMVRGDLFQLGQYAHALWPHIVGFDLLPPLPCRPTLQYSQASGQGNDRKKWKDTRK